MRFISTGSVWLTVERLRLFQEPVQPASLETIVLELLELSLAVYLGIVCELGALDKGEDDSIFQARQDRSNPVQREERIVCRTPHASHSESSEITHGTMRTKDE